MAYTSGNVITCITLMKYIETTDTERLLQTIKTLKLQLLKNEQFIPATVFSASSLI